MKPHIKIGIYDEEDLLQKKDKQAIERYFKDNPNTKFNCIDSKIRKRKGKEYLEVYMVKFDDYNLFDVSDL